MPCRSCSRPSRMRREREASRWASAAASSGCGVGLRVNPSETCARVLCCMCDYSWRGAPNTRNVLWRALAVPPCRGGCRRAVPLPACACAVSGTPPVWPLRRASETRLAPRSAASWLVLSRRRLGSPAPSHQDPYRPLRSRSANAPLRLSPLKSLRLSLLAILADRSFLLDPSLALLSPLPSASCARLPSPRLALTRRARRLVPPQSAQLPPDRSNLSFLRQIAAQRSSLSLSLASPALRWLPS
jgi:hypothetical protein